MPDKFRVINVGIGDFLPAIRERGVPVAEVDWKPPAQGDVELTDILFRLAAGFRDDDGESLIERANRQALARILAARPVLRRVRPAGEVLPGLGRDVILHAGPPVAWEAMCGPMRGAVLGAILYEKLADSPAEAEALVAAGRIGLDQTHRYGVVAPMAGVVSRSMPLLEVENEDAGNVAYAPLNEGIGHVLRFGANHPPVIQRLEWLEKGLAPALDRALAAKGGVSLKNVMAQALIMGDEMHQRNTAASLCFYRAISGELIAAAPDPGELGRIVSFLTRENEQFFLNIAMAACKSAMDTARNIPYSSVITAMSRNGVDFGITVSALGDRWITAPSLHPRGLYFPGYGEEDANPDMGDSAIVECYGIGGFAMGTAPAVARFVGAGNLAEALGYSIDMSHICVGRNPDLAMPNLDFAGVPTAIDLRRVVGVGILPIINSGVAHRNPGVGQVGAGLVTPPMEVMNKALRALFAALGDDGLPG